MSYTVGIDLGTTFTSAAVSGVGGACMVSLSGGLAVPSVAYRTTDGALLTGTAAEAAADDDPVGAARNFKRRLGDPSPLTLRGTPTSASELMAAQLQDVLTDVTNHMGNRPDSIMLTCPAIWGPYRRMRFTEVPILAGISEFRVITEPEAAAAHYSAERRLGEGAVVVVYDLGGGTFDTTILRMGHRGVEILGTPEGIEHMGGIDFDDSLRAHVDERLDGALSALDPADPALARFLAACVRAKEELSVEPNVTLTVPLESGPREISISQYEFNELIRPSVQLTTEALHRTITSAGLRSQDLSAVLLAGGSSRIPLIGQLIQEEFGKPVRAALHPKYTVALGAAATAAARRTRPTTPIPASVPPPRVPPRQPFIPASSAVVTPSPARVQWWLVAAAVVIILTIAGLIVATTI